MNKLSENLMVLRKKFNHTQEDLAKKVYISRQAVSKWERGESLPDIETLIAIADIYAVSIDDLLRANNISEKTHTINDVKNKETIKAVRKRTLGKLMVLWTIGLLSNYSLICGLLQTALFDIAPNIWLIWFTLPVIPPIIFAIRFRFNINSLFLPFFINVPFIAGIIFELIVLLGNPNGAWLAFLMIPVYYSFAIIRTVAIKKQNKTK